MIHDPRTTRDTTTRPTALRAAVFDMDGLLIDSEPLWRRAERTVFSEVGLHLTDDDCKLTTGLRIDEVVGHWFSRHPWKSQSPEVVGDRIVREVVRLVRTVGEEMPGASRALALCADAGLRLGLASSSSPALIDAVLDRLGFTDRFEVAHSASHEKHGKPHPDVYLTACARLGVSPAGCVAFEDSVNGVRAARAAGMRCIAVPGHEVPDAEEIASLADVVLASLELLSPADLGVGR
jgi:mannitol-1-/sugar-/sorbitol-6-/2-deoxyglucose-6-phosphatase